jgi:hypothetical protein
VKGLIVSVLAAAVLAGCGAETQGDLEVAIQFVPPLTRHEKQLATRIHVIVDTNDFYLEHIANRITTGSVSLKALPFGPMQIRVELNDDARNTFRKGTSGVFDHLEGRTVPITIDVREENVCESHGCVLHY